MAFHEPGVVWLVLDRILVRPFGRPSYRKIVESLELRGDEKVLDFGSGSGGCAEPVAEILTSGKGRLTCIDLSERWMGVLKRRLRRFANVDYLEGWLLDMMIPSNSQDVIIMNFVLHGLEPEDRQKILDKLALILKSGGRLYLCDPLSTKSYAVPLEDARSLLENTGLKEVSHEVDKVPFMGPFYKFVCVKES